MFIDSVKMSYRPDVISFFDFCDCNCLVLKDLHDMALLVGHMGWVRFYCCSAGLLDSNNLILVVNDDDVANLIRYINVERVVDIYVETIEAVFDCDMPERTSYDEHDLGGPIVELMQDSESISNEEDTDENDSTFSDDFEDVDFDIDDLDYDEYVDEAVEWVGLNDTANQIIDHPKDKVFPSSKANKGKTLCYQIYQDNANDCNFEFEVGMCFNTVDDFREAVRTYSNMQGKPIKFTKNCSDKVQVTCECGWVMYASFISKNDRTFQVKTIKGEHSCYRAPSSKHCTFDFLAKKYQDHLRSNPEWPVTSMQEMMQMENRTSLSIWKMYRAKKYANKLIHGSELEQYATVWSYCEEIRRTNPNTTVKVQCKEVSTTQTCIFKRLYICWGALKLGFLAGCRPVLGLDGTHLKTSNGGVLLCAVGIDGNNGMYPVAYAMVLKENRKSWEWFIGLLIQDLNIQNNYVWTIISDKQKGLIRAVEELLPNAEHRFCVRHMYNNFKQIHKGLQLKSLLWKAASASRLVDFNSEMEKMKTFNIEAYNWVRARHPRNWARSHFSTWPKCDMLLNNLCESFNNVILKARGKPIVTMFEIIRVILMKRLHTQRDKLVRSGGEICPNIQRILENNKRGVQDYILEWNGLDKFEVKGWRGDKWTVELGSKSCSCNKWDLSGIPCVHAIACIFFKREKVEDYVDFWYRKNTFLKAYEHMLNPIKGQKEWPTTCLNLLVPWNVKGKKVGRPSLHARKREQDELEQKKYGLKRHGTKYTCSNCGVAGHTKKSCGHPIPTTSTTRSKLSVKKNIASQDTYTEPPNSSLPSFTTAVLSDFLSGNGVPLTYSPISPLCGYEENRCSPIRNPARNPLSRNKRSAARHFPLSRIRVFRPLLTPSPTSPDPASDAFRRTRRRPIPLRNADSTPPPSSEGASKHSFSFLGRGRADFNPNRRRLSLFWFR
ncbi:hypothetical protein KSP39_PZI008986 [Platanthera zijinensis]|uniref:SWIM-type domain-containing protein n=1 Tax=Platanthera zijinensis TaxID=2320716 RepID=A0AAP0BKX8_9ASPA